MRKISSTMRVERKSAPSAGFTLLELLVALSLTGLILAVALPASFGLLDRRVQSTASDLAQRLIAARVEAQRTGERVTIEPAAIAPNVAITAEPERIEFLPDGTSSGGLVEISSGDVTIPISVSWHSSAILLDGNPQ